MMTLKECCDAISAILDRPLTYDGAKVTVTFEDHNEALRVMITARAALAVMLDKEGGK